jgi:hypothetical protein
LIVDTLIPEKEHAVLGPSGWDRWSACPGSVVLEEGRLNPTSVYAAWGTVAHEIVAHCLTNNADPETFTGRVFEVPKNDGSGDCHEIEVDMEMADACSTCLSVVETFVDKERGDVLHVEQEVPIGHLTGESGATGTADVVAIINGGTRLLVIDWKFGQGVQVVAQGNGQLRMYALGALEKVGLVHDEIAEVELVICQPRISEEPTTEIISVQELRDFEFDEVRLAAGRVELAKSDPEGDIGDFLNPGEKQCRFCRAKAICPALQEAVTSTMLTVSSAAPEDFADLTLPKKAASLAPPDTYSPEKLAEAFRAIPLIEDWLSAVGTEALNRLMNREQLPGLYLGAGKKGRRAWADAGAAEAELKRQKFKVDEMYEKKVISPTKAEKMLKGKPRLLKKLLDAAGIDQGEGKPKVCREGLDDNKPFALPSPTDFADLTADAGANPLLAD